MKEELKIMNPVRLLTVEDFKAIAELSLQGEHEVNESALIKQAYLDRRTNYFIKRFESITRGKFVYDGETSQEIAASEKSGKRVWQPALLTKEMFVNTAKRPVDEEWNLERDKEIADYEAAQKKLWFKGFEIIEQEGGCTHLSSGQIDLKFWADGSIEFDIGMDGSDSDAAMCSKDLTPFDFLTELDRYNRHATTPIHLEWSEDFLNELLKA